MGFDSRIYIASVHRDTPDADGFVAAYPNITIDMPRLGWSWAYEARDNLTAGSTKYRVYDNTEEDGVTEDAYGAPILALDPHRLLKHLRAEYPETLNLPTIVALTAALKKVRKRKWRNETKVLFYGH